MVCNHAIPNGLQPVAEAFRLHVTAEGNALIKQAEDAATSGSVEEQVLVRKIIDLHDKYMIYVTDCFQNHTLFHKALTDSFSKTLSSLLSCKPPVSFVATRWISICVRSNLQFRSILVKERQWMNGWTKRVEDLRIYRF